jgi:hypothetical protein
MLAALPNGGNKAGADHNRVDRIAKRIAVDLR